MIEEHEKDEIINAVVGYRPAPKEEVGRLRLKDTPESRKRWAQVERASEEIKTWDALKRAEAAVCTCKVYCGHPVDDHSMVTKRTTEVICRACPPAARPSEQTREAAKALDKWDVINKINPLDWLAKWHPDQYENVSLPTIQGRDLMALFAAEFADQQTADALAEAALTVDVLRKQQHEDGYTIHRLREETAAVRHRLEAVEKLLYDLTPGGSEFVNDPAYYADYVRRKLASMHESVKAEVKRRKAAEFLNHAEEKSDEN
jgi:hypothetical protein